MPSKFLNFAKNFPKKSTYLSHRKCVKTHVRQSRIFKTPKNFLFAKGGGEERGKEEKKGRKR